MCQGLGYSLAIRRNRGGQASAASAIAMIAGDPVHGALKDKHIITKYEFKVAVVDLLNTNAFQESVEALHAIVPVGEARDMNAESRAIVSVELFQFLGDATHSEAIDKSKMHLASFTTQTCGAQSWADVSGATEGDDTGTIIAELEQTLERRADTCDMQLVTLGTGEETYRIFGRQFQSVSAPSWEQRCNQAVHFPGRLSVYCFGLDQGPDNIGCTSRVRHAVKRVNSVMTAISFCIFHIFHLVVKDVLTLFDAWEY